MTDKEIKKALECCQTQYARNCKDCPYEKYKTHSISAVTCSSRLRKDLLDLLNRQQAEIERLEVDFKSAQSVGKGFQSAYDRAMGKRNTAIQEFAKRLKEKGAYNSFNELIIFEDMVDAVEKEMTEAQNNV
jgi:hypothetical protein